ncbi:Large proline-rich protein bag6 [Mortierella claussenii]|nr:Large proline-rich protein bag6 [Mortierella claussenii]
MTDIETTSSDAPITLQVKTIDSHTHTVSVSVQETVLDLKEKLALMLQVPSARQRLIFRGRVMVDDKRLSEYDAPAPRTSTGPTAGRGLPRLFDHSELLFSIIGVDDNMDSQNQLMQALTGGLPTGMELDGHPAVIHIDGDPAAIRSLFGGHAVQAGGTGEHARTRLRAGRPIPLGASLPHLATIEAELTRASTQLRNVQTILAHPADQLEGIELEPVDVPELETVDEDVDGDSTDLSRMVSILTQLSETNRSMANHLQTLSSQYNQTLLQPAERLHLQRVSLRAARAMYRLASVQNTVFPMLANATFVGTAPGAVSYRFQPAPRMNAPSRETPGAAPLGSTIPRLTSVDRRAALLGIPVPPSSLGAEGSRATWDIPATVVQAHARATARNIQAALAATAQLAARLGSVPAAPSAPSAPGAGAAGAAGAASTATPSLGTAGLASARSSSATAHQSGQGPVGQMVLGPNGSLSYTIQGPPRPATRPATGVPSYAATAAAALNPFTSPRDQALASRFMIPADFAAAEFSDFWRNLSGHSMPSTETEASFLPQSSTSEPSLAGAVTDLQANVGDGSEPSRMSSRRRERPDEFLTGTDARSAPRRRLTTHQSPSLAELDNRSRQEHHTLPAGLVPFYSSAGLVAPLQATGASSASSPAYNLGRIGVFISAILRMVDQPREDGSPRTLADVICNDPESPSTPLQDLVRNVAESVTVRETRSIVEGYPAPMRNIHPVLNSFIRDRALNGQQLTESNLDLVAVMFANGIMNAVHVEEILETMLPPPTIQISSEDIRRISLDVLREHFRRLIYLVVAAPAGRESNWPTFARDLILWIRDVVGSWRVAFYGLIPERDHAEAQRIATHVMGSAIHANGRRWVELSNRATNTLVNVLCANIVPRRRGEEQPGLVGGAWPLMATAPRQNISRSRTCMAPSLLGSTAPPAPLGPNNTFNGTRAFDNSSFSDASSSATRSAAIPLEAERISENLSRRISEMMAPLGINLGEFESLATSRIQDAVRAELISLNISNMSSSASSSSPGATSAGNVNTGVPTSSINPPSSSTNTADSENKPKNLRTRVEEVEDEDMR